MNKINFGVFLCLMFFCSSCEEGEEGEEKMEAERDLGTPLTRGAVITAIEGELRFGLTFEEVKLCLLKHGLNVELSASSIRVNEIAEMWGVTTESPRVLELFSYRSDLTQELGLTFYFNHKKELNGYEKLVKGNAGNSLSSQEDLINNSIFLRE